MTRKGFALAAWVGFLLCVSASASNYKVVDNRDDFYYGHISYADVKNDGLDAVVFREGRLVPEVAILNLPLGPGDLIETTGARRTEIQFDNGTIIRLDLNSRLKIETILAQSLSTLKKMSNLVLEKGQVYVMYKRFSSLEIFQVVTPRAAVKLDHNSVALIRLSADGNTDVQVERGKAFLLYGGDTGHVSQKRLNSKQRGVVTAEDKVELTEYETLSDFKAWNESLNAHFLELHEGSYLPKPLQHLPPAVFEFAQKFGNIYGEWIWHDLYGYVWRPYLNDHRYPWGNWSPYINGSWTSYSGQMFWVPGEPWGWVPYHLGLWMWDKNKGWVWAPGSLFAPAWAVWEFYEGMYCWRPFYLYDWMSGFGDFWLTPLWSGYYGAGYFPGQNPSYLPPNTNVRYTVRKDQLKKSDSPALPMPKDMKKVFGSTLAALKRKDPSLLASLEGLPRHTVAVKKEDFLSPSWREKLVPFDRLAGSVVAAGPGSKPAAPRRSADVSRDAALAIERGRVSAELRALSTFSPGSQREAPRFAPSDIEFSRVPVGASRAAAATAFRFRDWNPDIKAAVRLGVEIAYSSRTNEVACPQLGLTSRQIGPSMRSPGTFGGFALSGGASSSSSSSSGRASAANPGSSSGSRSHSSGSSGSSRQKN
jgi:hypothetical protein